MFTYISLRVLSRSKVSPALRLAAAFFLAISGSNPAAETFGTRKGMVQSGTIRHHESSGTSDDQRGSGFQVSKADQSGSMAAGDSAVADVTLNILVGLIPP